MHYQIYRFRRYLLVLLSVPEIFGVKIYPNMLFVYCSQNFWHFSMPRFAKFTASFHFGWIICRPWGMDKCLEIPWDGCSPTLFKWTQSDKHLSILFSVVISLPWMLIPCKYTVLPSFLQWFCTCDIFGRGHGQSRLVTHFVLHKMSQCIEKVGDWRYALWECRL